MTGAANNVPLLESVKEYLMGFTFRCDKSF